MRAHFSWIVIKCIFLFLLHALFAEAQGIQFQVEVFVGRYRNQDHRNAADNCCTGNGANCNDMDCNNQFIFCAGPNRSVTSVNNDMCPYGMFSFANAPDEFSFTMSPSSQPIAPGSQVLNPIVFRGSGRYSGQFHLNIVVNNVRTNDVQLVDSFNRGRRLNPSAAFTGSRDRFRGEFRQAEIDLFYRVQCAANYYGSNCDVNCVETDRFTCDPNSGSIVCRMGYQNEATNCSSCVPATGCDTTNGYCNVPGECICIEGFTGPLCDTVATTLQGSETVTNIPTNNSPSGNTGNGNLGMGSSLNQTTTDLNPLESEQQGLSRGGVAGIVITVLLIVALLIVGVAIGVLFWVYQPWSNGWFGVEARLKNVAWRNDAISNPVYEKTEMDSSHSPVRGIRYTPTTNGQAAGNGNGQVNLNIMTQSLDDDNPLYASSALEKILSPRAERDGTRNANGILQEELTRGMVNGHAQSNSAVTTRLSPQHNSAKIGTLRESGSLEHILMTADVRDLSNQSKPRSSRPPPIPLKPKIKLQLPNHRNSIGSLPRTHGMTQEVTTSFLTASQSLDNLLKPNNSSNFLNPYGEYGDKTLQRVASGNSVNEDGAEGSGARKNQMFDNPDYEFVDYGNSMESGQQKDIDYEEIDS